jgi:DNA-binding transcriptional LysR family regulator
LAGRSDLVIGAPEPGASVEGYCTQPLGEVQLGLAMPTTHPLARAEEPLATDALSCHRVVRQAAWPFGPRGARRTEELVTVDDYRSQVEAIRNGVGIGYVPAYLVNEDVEAGRLVMKLVADAPTLRLVVAWRTERAGYGLRWFVDQLSDHNLRARLMPQRAVGSS